jgi:pimeloyl-ACP methyl ester carboxylesterase
MGADNRRDEGQFSELREGRTAWRREGSSGGVPLVLVHGATVPSWEFDFLIPPLLDAGFQTLRFDLYGHGASDRLSGAYTFDRFARQVVEVIEASRFARPATLLGHSFGAALVAAVATRHPELVSRLVLVAPMLNFSSTSRWARLFSVPAVGEIAMRWIGTPALIRRRRRRYAAIGKAHLTARFVEQLAGGGFGRALVSMFRHGALGDQSAHYSALRNLDRPVMVVTGTRDAIIPPDHIAHIRSLLPAHLHCPIDAEHNLLLTHPDVVANAMLTWAHPPA